MTRAENRTPRARRRWRRTGIAALACALAALLPACSVEGDEEGRATEIPAPEQAVGEELMIALSQAKNYHHKADVFLADDDPELAERALRRLLEVPFPDMSPEAQDVKLDARARLGKLLLESDEHAEALAVVHEGIASAERDSFFLANLYTVKGEILEARAEALEARASEAGDREDEIRDARRRALGAYAESIAINEELQRRLMSEGAP